MKMSQDVFVFGKCLHQFVSLLFSLCVRVHVCVWAGADLDYDSCSRWTLSGGFTPENRGVCVPVSVVFFVFGTWSPPGGAAVALRPDCMHMKVNVKDQRRRPDRRSTQQLSTHRDHFRPIRGRAGSDVIAFFFFCFHV